MSILKQLLKIEEKKCPYCKTTWDVNVGLARKAHDQDKTIRLQEDEIAQLKTDLEEFRERVTFLEGEKLKNLTQLNDISLRIGAATSEAREKEEAAKKLSDRAESQISYWKEKNSQIEEKHSIYREILDLFCNTLMEKYDFDFDGNGD